MGVFDKDKVYGLVLEGGGAKGAYEIGVWKAFREIGVNVGAVVGTSVGAINGALFAQDSFEFALDFWRNIKYSSIINVEDNVFKGLYKADFSELSIQEALQQFANIIKNKGLDISPLKKLLETFVDEEKIRQSPIDFGFSTYNVTDMKAVDMMIKDVEEGKLSGYILGSAYLPSFKSEKIFGKRFIDGSVHNLSPVNMLINQGYKDIIVVRIQGIGIEQKYDRKGLNIIEIYSERDLGGILEFDSETAKRNIMLGYFDTMALEYDLKGSSYYIQSKHKEAYYLKQFLMLPKKNIIRFLDDIGDKNTLKRYKHKERLICEFIIPMIAKMMKFGKEATYEMIYIGFLELVAGFLDLDFLTVYTMEEFRDEIKKKYYNEDKDIYEVLLDKEPLLRLYSPGKKHKT